MLAPVLHAVAGVIVSDDVLVGMIILADDGHLLHVKPRPLEFLHCFLCLGVGSVNGYNRVRFQHDFRSFLSLFFPNRFRRSFTSSGALYASDS